MPLRKHRRKESPFSSIRHAGATRHAARAHPHHTLLIYFKSENSQIPIVHLQGCRKKSWTYWPKRSPISAACLACERISGDRELHTDDNALDFGVLYAPTPGTAEFLTIPESGTGMLVGSALGVLALLRRKPTSRSECLPFALKIGAGIRPENFKGLPDRI